MFELSFKVITIYMKGVEMYCNLVVSVNYIYYC